MLEMNALAALTKGLFYGGRKTKIDIAGLPCLNVLTEDIKNNIITIIIINKKRKKVQR
jgi:hypothetical protein